MKKILVLLLALVLTATLAASFVGCSETHVENITVYVPDGGPALGMAYLMKDVKAIDGVTIKYEIVKGAQEIAAAVTNGDADVAIMPTNLAAKLYNAGKEIVLVGTNSHGLLYLLSDQENFALNDLKGKVLHLVGQAGTPEAVVKKVLDANSIAYEESDAPVDGKVALKFYADGSQVIQGLVSGSIHYAILGEPAVSTALQKAAAKNVQIVADLQALWATATGSDASYPQTALVVKKSLIKTDEKLVQKIAEQTVVNKVKLSRSATSYLAYLRDEMGATQVPATLTAEGVLRVNLDPTFGAAAKTEIEAYLNVLLAFDKTLIGGKLPDSGFYYDDNGALTSYKEMVDDFE